MNNTSNVICPHCNKPFELGDAFKHQIEKELSKKLQKETEAEIQRTKQEEHSKYSYELQRIVQEKELQMGRAIQEEQAKRNKEMQDKDFELERVRQENERISKQAKQETALAVSRAKQEGEFKLSRILSEKSASDNESRELREQMMKLMKELANERKEKENAQLAAQKEYADKINIERQEAREKAFDEAKYTILEKEETIRKLKNQVTDMKLTAEQGSQQGQGEALELDIEKQLRDIFRMDTITEVKKGVNGADIVQTVNEINAQNCGLILWECKNAKNYSNEWLVKLKEELITQNAQFGVIVFNPTDGKGDDFKELAENIWLVKPRYAIMLAAGLRRVCIDVSIANHNAEGKDVKMVKIYDYLVGDNFGSRMRYIIQSYNTLDHILKKEQKQTKTRWKAQEKAISNVVSQLSEIKGELYGISGQDIISLPDDIDIYDIPTLPLSED